MLCLSDERQVSIPNAFIPARRHCAAAFTTFMPQSGILSPRLVLTISAAYVAWVLLTPPLPLLDWAHVVYIECSYTVPLPFC